MIKCLFVVLGHEHKSRAFSMGNSQLCDESQEKPYSYFSTVGSDGGHPAKQQEGGSDAPSLHLPTLLPLPQSSQWGSLPYSHPKHKGKLFRNTGNFRSPEYRCPFSGPFVSRVKLHSANPGASFQGRPWSDQWFSTGPRTSGSALGLWIPHGSLLSQRSLSLGLHTGSGWLLWVVVPVMIWIRTLAAPFCQLCAAQRLLGEPGWLSTLRSSSETWRVHAARLPV